MISLHRPRFTKRRIVILFFVVLFVAVGVVIMRVVGPGRIPQPDVHPGFAALTKAKDALGGSSIFGLPDDG